MEYLLIISQALWIIAPAYIANGLAVFFGGGTPIDFGKNYKDKKRILGDGKTWRGLFIGTFLGMTGGFCFAVLAIFISRSEFSWLSFSDFGKFPIMIPIIFSICFGALAGDIIESFFKRRIGKKRGEDWIPFDQLDFILGVLFFCFLMSVILQAIGATKENWFYQNFTIYHILALIIITPFFHLFANFAHKKAKSKSK